MAKSERINPWKLFTGFWVPTWLGRRKEISQGAKLSYGRLLRFAGKDGHCNPGAKKIASELGVSKRQVTKYLKELREVHLIEAESRGRGRANNYYFLKHKWMETEELRGNHSSLHRGNYGSSTKGTIVPFSIVRESIKESQTKERETISRLSFTEKVEKAANTSTLLALFTEYLTDLCGRPVTSQQSQALKAKCRDRSIEDLKAAVFYTVENGWKRLTFPDEDRFKKNPHPHPDDLNQRHLNHPAYKN